MQSIAGRTTQTLYDAAGNLSSRSLTGTDIDSLSLGFTYTPDDQLANVNRTANGNDAGSSAHTYNADGLITQRLSGKGILRKMMAGKGVQPTHPRGGMQGCVSPTRPTLPMNSGTSLNLYSRPPSPAVGRAR